jgi:hypothetical protein
MTWTQYKKGNKKYNEPAVAIYKNGRVVFNKASMEYVGDVSAVQLFFDESKKLIGIKPCDESADHSFKLCGLSKNTKLLQAAKFLSGIGALDFEKAVHVKVAWSNKDKMIVIDIKDIDEAQNK